MSAARMYLCSYHVLVLVGTMVSYNRSSLNVGTNTSVKVGWVVHSADTTNTQSIVWPFLGVAWVRFAEPYYEIINLNT